MSDAKKLFHERVAESLIEQLKQGNAPWQKPWEGGEPGLFLPVNPTTGKRYRGMNVIHLMSQGRTDTRWMTYRQAAQAGWQVRRGEKGTSIQFWKFSEEQTKSDEHGEPVKVTVLLERPKIFYATVFNAEQIDGLPPPEPRKPQPWSAHERAEQILKGSGAAIKYAPGSGAFYRLSTDTIHLPDRGQFPTADSFYATALHEVAHSSGHPRRLNRDTLGHPFGSEQYAKEELRAEIASMILGDELGIGHDPRQHAAYVGSWIKILQDDPLEIFRAAAEAERIQEYVLSLEHRQVQKQAIEPTRDEADDDTLKQQLEVPMESAKQSNHHEQAVALARLREATVTADPNSTREEISAAREDRKLAELLATLNDEELIRLKAKYEREAQSSSSIGRTADAGPVPKKNLQDRKYLAVPYGERKAAKTAGALWDRAAKSWYVGPKADMQKLRRWFPENIAARQSSAMTPREEFSEALRFMGCVVSGEHPMMDGQKHRITVHGEKHSENSGSGFYVGHLDGHPAGYIKNNKTGCEMRWKSKGYVLDDTQKAAMRAEAADKLRARAAEQERLKKAAAQRVAQQIATLAPATEPTAYMKAKGIRPQPGVFTDARAQTTYVPATDADGKLWTMQYIREDGTKRFAKDSRKEGCFHVVGGIKALVKSPILMISEGYATAATLSQILGFATVAAFDSGNLLSVAKALHEKYPDKQIVIAGDDDRHLELTYGINPGRSKAQEAARAVGGKVLLPIFAPNENSYPTGLETVTPQKYREGQLSGQQHEALAKMKQYTDFNDLATKSVHGNDAVERQVRSVLDSLQHARVAHAIARSERSVLRRNRLQLA
jgi:putative DNA primase/helicase